MIEIWQEYSNFQTTSQRTIIKKGWFSDLEILEIHQKINNQQSNNTVPDTSNINKQNLPNRNEPPASEIGNPTQPNTQPKQTRTNTIRRKKLNLEN